MTAQTLATRTGTRTDYGDPYGPAAYRDARLDRLESVAGLPPLPWPPRQTLGALDRAFYTHTQPNLSPAGNATLIRDRIATGLCNAWFAYSGPSDPIGPNPYQAAIVDSGPPIPVSWSIKNADDVDRLRDWCQMWPADWRPLVTAIPWEEPQHEYHGREWVWHDLTTRLADVCDQYGIRVHAHLETWQLANPKADGGPDGALALLLPVLPRLTAGVTWSLYQFACEHGEDHVDAAVGPRDVLALVDFMGRPELAGVPYGVTAIGISLPVDTPADSYLRSERCDRALRATYAALDGAGISRRGHYSLPVGVDPTRNYLDAQVTAALPGWVVTK